MKILKIIFFPFSILLWILKIFFMLIRPSKKERARLKRNAKNRAKSKYTMSYTKSGKYKSAAQQRADYNKFGQKN